MNFRTLRRYSAACTVMVLAACGPSGSAGSGEHAETDAEHSLAADAPKAIVSLSAAATESLFAIGAGAQVVAVDDQSNFPAEAPKTDLSGFTPNIEAIAATKPDLVVIADDSKKLSESLGKLGIKVLVQLPPADLDGAYAQIAELGKVTGHETSANELVETMKQKIDFAVRQAPKGVGLSYYHELDDTFYSATSKTFIGSVYSLFGLKNIADEADKDGFGYPQLSPEYIAKANPDMIFLADTKAAGQSPATVAARQGWG